MAAHHRSEVSYVTAPARRRRFGFVLFALAAGMMLGVVLVTLLVRAAPAAILEPLASFITGRPLHMDVSAPAVVDKIRQLSRLETVVYSLDKIVEGKRQNPLLPDFLAGDKLLLVAHGEVVAGIDMAHLTPNDIHVNGDTVHLKLPSAQILSTTIDNGRTRVYSRSTGLLVPIDPNLESEVRQTAQEQIAKAALDDGILDKARQNARAGLTTLLYGLGFHTVDVQ